MVLSDDLTPALLDSAWLRVAANAGGPGVDGVTVDSFNVDAREVQLPRLLEHALNGTYRCRPFRRIVIQKRPGSKDTRTLLVPCIRDRVLQTALARILSRSFEEEFLEASYAYRPDRGVDRAVARILQLRDRGYTHVLDADITAYFDNVSHSLLIRQLEEQTDGDASTMSLLRQWVAPTEWDGHRSHNIPRGIPQGSPISPLFANLFLTPLDTALATGDHKLIRYSDDFLILCKGPSEAQDALRLATEALKPLSLDLKPEKTRVTDFDQGFKFLGVQFRGHEAMIPWKAKDHPKGHIVFVANRMTGKQLRPFLDQLPTANPPPTIAAATTATTAEPPPPSLPTPPQDTIRDRDPLPPDMPYLYLTQPGAVLRKSGDRFLVDHDGGIILDIPYHRLEHILIFGNIQITSQAMAEALDHDIALSLFSRQGRYRGSLNGPASHNVMLRLRQFQIHQDEAVALAIARECIRFKIENALTVLEHYEERQTPIATKPRGADQQVEHEESAHEIDAAEAQMAELQAQLDSVDSLEALLGHEGAAAKAYFGALSRFNRSTLIWEGRRKHPATDPLNALLSLTYTLLLNELTALLRASGLDPAIGFLHQMDGNRPSLALDLLEPFRSPVADRLVWTLVNRGQFSIDDFEQRDLESGMFLRPDAQRRYFEAYERWMLAPGADQGASFRRLLQKEVENWVKFLRDGVPEAAWSPFCFGFEATREGTGR